MKILLSVLVLMKQATGVPYSELSKCLKERKNPTNTTTGAFVPECDSDGNFEREQTHLSESWCVDSTGKEIPGTRLKAPTKRWTSCPSHEVPKDTWRMDFTCTNGVHPKPIESQADCTQYLTCANGNKWTQSCPASPFLAFDPRTKACNWLLEVCQSTEITDKFRKICCSQQN